MIESIVLALGIGIVSGLRTFTSLAAVFLMRGGYPGIVLAVGEYVADLSPKVPSRTAFPSNVVRALSGAIAAWFLTAAHGGAPMAGAAAGVAGALIGTYGGHAARIAAIEKIGAIPAGIAEDVVAVALAALVVTR
jgi:uncharacterized membrane protein